MRPTIPVSGCLAVASALALILIAVPAPPAAARVATLKPRYLPPSELGALLGAAESGTLSHVRWVETDGEHVVEVRRHDAANLVLLSGTDADVARLESLAQSLDVPPRQISIEARIVEIDRDRALNAGFDWSTIQTNFSGRALWTRDRYYGGSKNTRLEGQGAVEWRDMLRLLEQKGAATYRDAPRILTLNNRRATILDGQRVTYVTRYSSFTNLYQTDSLDAGLRLSVVPSLGESGYLTLDIRAELTSLTREVSGSPVKDGQIVENTIVVKDGETVLLGGFTRTLERSTRRGFPVLGRVLPFLFSREIEERSTQESFVVIAPHVVDLDPPSRIPGEGPGR